MTQDDETPEFDWNGDRRFNDRLSFARDWAFSKYSEPGGTRCPLCDQHMHLDKRRLRPVWAAFLVWLYGAQSDENAYVNVLATAPRFIMRSKDYTWLAHRGLMESAPNENGGRTRSGLWRLTQLGRLYVRGMYAAPVYAFTYNREVRQWSGDKQTVREALDGSPFSYDELMGYEAAP